MGTYAFTRLRVKKKALYEAFSFMAGCIFFGCVFDKVYVLHKPF